MLSAIIVAAGKGERMGGVKKQFLPLNGIPLFLHSVKAFLNTGADEIIITVPQEDLCQVQQWLTEYQMPKSCQVVAGGASRQESVKNAFAHCHIDSGLVAIHDAARPFIQTEDIVAVCRRAETCGAATLGVPVSDTVKQVENETITATLNRNILYLAQTPQVFRKTLYQKALLQSCGNYTDDCQLLEQIGFPVKMVIGSPNNRKLTTQEDLNFLNKDKRNECFMRIGHGYDVHQLVEDRRLILCGIEIPYENGLLGHSDADVATHALIDSLLGAAALGDIGKWFPDNDDKWKGADSLCLLKTVWEHLQDSGYQIQNFDLTILAQQPKLSPYISMMKQKLAQTLSISIEQINIKATTEEKLGFTGRKEGIAAHCVALLNCQ